MKKLACSILTVLAISGCQTPPDIQQLQSDKNRLQGQLNSANNQISQLKSTQATLNAELQERDRIVAILSEEKQSRVATSTELRGQVRQFIQQQVDGLKAFLLRGNLLDYVGGELVERKTIDESPLLIVDLANTVPKDGSLTSIGGYFNRSGSLKVKVMRKVEDQLVVVWESLPLSIEDKGLQKTNFSVSVGVQKGDVVAYFIETPGLVGYDMGTGDSRYLKQDVGFGKMIAIDSLMGEKLKRAYAIGVYGLLDVN